MSIEIFRDQKNQNNVYLRAKDNKVKKSILKIEYEFPFSENNYYAAKVYLQHLRCNRDEFTKNIISNLEIKVNKTIIITFEIIFDSKKIILNDDSLEKIRKYIFSYKENNKMYVFTEDYISRIKMKILSIIESNKNNKKYFLEKMSHEVITMEKLNMVSVYSKLYKGKLELVDKEAVLNFYQDVLKQATIFVIAVGNISDDNFEKIKLKFKGGKKANNKDVDMQYLKLKKKEVTIKKENAKYLSLTYVVKDYILDDELQIQLITSILSKRLEKILEEEKDYVYYISIRYDKYRKGIYIVTELQDSSYFDLVKNTIISEVRKLSKKNEEIVKDFLDIKHDMIQLLSKKNKTNTEKLMLIEKMKDLQIENYKYRDLIKRYLNTSYEELLKTSKKLKLILTYII